MSIEMSKILLIPVLAFTVAALGCGGSTNDGAGQTGTAGATGGSSGAAAGSGGSTAGSCGSPGGDAGIEPPACTTDVFSPTMFCTVLLAFCGNCTTGYTNMAECMTTYAALGTSNPFKQQCESEHLCNAANDTGSDRTLHCGHAVGMGLCNF
jgi:hypothetical protein